MRQKTILWLIWLLVSGLICLGIGIFALCVGSSGISAQKIIHLIIEGKNTDIEYSILFNLRLPRIILGFAVGGVLGISGAILQGLFRNPLVEPYTLGISGGAALGVCLNLILRLSERIGILTLPLSGFLGAVMIILLVYLLSARKGILKIQELLLCGVMVSFISSSAIMFIMAVSRTEQLQGIVFWLMGSLQEPNWLLIKAALLVSIAGLFICYFFALDLNAIYLGEEEARHLGVDVETTKRTLFFLISALTGMCVSICGIIGFVGLLVPHFGRMFLGQDYRVLLGGSFLWGATFLILCDTLARTIIAPVELPVGVLTGILGGSLFVWSVTKKGLSSQK